MKIQSAFVLCVTLLSACGTNPPAKFHKGQQVIAKNWTHAHMNGQVVLVMEEPNWRFVKNYGALKTYIVETPDGKIYAAQEFQLQEFKFPHK